MSILDLEGTIICFNLHFLQRAVRASQTKALRVYLQAHCADQISRRSCSISSVR